MTKGQRIEAKFGNVARQLASASRSFKGLGFTKSKTCAGIMPRFKRWKARLKERLANL